MSDAPLVLECEGPRVVGSRVKYPEDLSVYASLYGHDERTIKRWIKRGRESKPEPKLPPLHRPEKMPEWWAEKMSIRCPAGVLNAVKKGTVAEPPTPPMPSSVNDPPPQAPTTPPPALPDRDFSDIEVLGIEENVQQLRRSLAVASRMLNEARAAQPPDEGLCSSRQRVYRETFSELRKAENDLLEWQEARGLLVPTDEVRAHNNRIASAVFTAVHRLVRNVRPKLTGKSDTEQDKIWEDMTLACFASLKDAKFVDYDAVAGAIAA